MSQCCSCKKAVTVGKVICSDCWDEFKKEHTIKLNDVHNENDVKVVNSKWILGRDMPDYSRVLYSPYGNYCKECRKPAPEYVGYGEQLYDYCPNCGADMGMK